MSFPVTKSSDLYEESDNGNLSPTKEQVARAYKESYRRFMQNFSVSNNKVRYYCNKTLSMRQSLNEIIDDLVIAQTHAMSYLNQDPVTLDHYALSMVFTLIEKTAMIIDWNSLNHDCFWKDFCRETKALRYLIETAQMVVLETVHAATDKANRAFEILEGVVPESKTPLDTRLKSTETQPTSDPSLDGIKVICSEPSESIIIEWNDEDEIQSVKLQKTEQNFRLRFLRCMLFYARKSLELILFTLYRVEIAIRLEFPLNKLIKCNGLTAGQLIPHELNALSKAKKRFDGKWTDILTTLYKFKAQLEQLEKHRGVLKKMLKDPTSCPKLSPQVVSIPVLIDDPLILHIVSEAISAENSKQSYDFSMFPNRTDDIVSIIEDMWDVDRTSYKKMDQLLIVTYTALIQIQSILEKKEEQIFKGIVGEMLIQRDRVKRYLKRALEIFNHCAFTGMHIQQNGYTKSTLKHVTKVQSPRSESSDEDSEDDCEDNIERDQLFWVELNGGFKVTISDQKEFLVSNPSKKIQRFGQLDEEQKVIFTTKLIERLTYFLSTEASLAKIVLERASETKSLVKRLKQKDRQSDNLSSIIGNGVYHIQQLLRLMKTMNILRTVPAN